MSELISYEECLRTLQKYGDRDKASDIQLVRYYTTQNELVVKILYKGCDLKCIIDKADLIIGKIPNVSSIEEFENFYLKPLPFDYLMRIEGEESSKEPKINISVSQT